jgi:hypothetical protein
METHQLAVRVWFGSRGRNDILEKTGVFCRIGKTVYACLPHYIRARAITRPMVKAAR